MAPKNTFDAGATLPEIMDSINPEVSLLTRYKSALLAYLRFPGSLLKAINIRHDWMEESLAANGATVSGDQTSGDTSLEVATGQGSRFVAGDIIQVDGSRELISVTSISTDTLTVVRGIRSTTAVAIVDGATIKIMNNPAIESSNAPTARPVNRVRRANYTEIFTDTAAVSRSTEKVSMIGVDSEMAEQKMLVRADLLRRLAFTVINGKIQASNPEGTSLAPRTMNGIIQMILAGSAPSVVAAAGQPVTEAMLNTLMQDMWTKGGKPVALACGPTQKRKISTLLEGRQRYPVEQSTLGAVAERFISDFGTLDLLEPDIFIPSDVILVLDPDKIALAKLGTEGGDPFEEIDLGRSGLVTSTQIVGEFSLEMHNAGDGGHGMISGLAT